MIRFLIATTLMITTAVSFSYADNTSLALDPAELTKNGNYQIAGNWSELKRGWNTLKLYITDTANQPTTGASVKVVYDMIGMPMNPPDKPVEEKGDGNYEKQVFLGMKGDWQFDVTVNKDSIEDSLMRIENIEK